MTQVHTCKQLRTVPDTESGFNKHQLLLLLLDLFSISNTPSFIDKSHAGSTGEGGCLWELGKLDAYLGTLSL